MSGSGATEFVGLCVYDLFPVGLSEERRARNEQVFADGHRRHYEDERHDVWTDVTIDPIFDPSGNVARLAIYSLSQSDDGDEDGRSSSRFASLVDRRHPDPIREMERHEASGMVLDELIDKEREVLELYYFEGLTMKEIGKLLRLSESRVCQIHGQALERLRGELVDRAEDLSTT